MQEKDKYILVLGSKPNSKLPLVEVTNIYAANGASEIGSYYKKIFPSSILISVVVGKEFEKNYEVQKRVIESAPEEMISRSGYIGILKYKLNNDIKFIYFSNFKGLLFQSNFFKKNFFDVLIKETYYEDDILNKIKHIFKCVRHNAFTGVSTGFFSILYALNNHPNCKIILSGIGMSKGSHLYNDKNRYNKRSVVDRMLFNSLKKEYTSRLMTTDNDFSNDTGIQIWEGKTIDEE